MIGACDEHYRHSMEILTKACDEHLTHSMEIQSQHNRNDIYNQIKWGDLNFKLNSATFGGNLETDKT
jgi:hypothetical protein